MAHPELLRPERHVDAYQGPSALEDAAVASNAGFAVEKRLRYGDLVPENEAMFGSPFETSAWQWTRPSAPTDALVDAPPSPRSGLTPSTVPKKSHPRVDPQGLLLDTVWIGQHDESPLLADLNGPRAIWPASQRGRRLLTEQVSDPPVRFIAMEELIGRIDEIDVAAGEASCTVWRRRFEHDSYVAVLAVSEFPARQRRLVRSGQMFYWTFGDLIVRGLEPYAVQRIAVKRPTPALVVQRAHERALRRLKQHKAR